MAAMRNIWLIVVLGVAVVGCKKEEKRSAEVNSPGAAPKIDVTKSDNSTTTVQPVGGEKSDCTGGTCSQICKTGQACEFSCSGGSCAQTCEKGAKCTFSCNGGTCAQKCGDETCALSCNGGSCTQQCEGACAKSCVGGSCK